MTRFVEEKALQKNLFFFCHLTSSVRPSVHPPRVGPVLIGIHACCVVNRSLWRKQHPPKGPPTGRDHFKYGHDVYTLIGRLVELYITRYTRNILYSYAELLF